MIFIGVPSPVFFYYELIISIIFFFDILVGFNKVYYNKKNQYQISRTKIAKKYLKLWFWIDLVAFIPFNMFFDLKKSFFKEIKVVKITQIFNILRIFRVIKIFKRLDGISNKMRSPSILIKSKLSHEIFLMQIFINLIVLHLFACLAYYLPITFSPNLNWVQSRNILEYSLFHRYLYSLHWVLETFVTVGYGENPME